MFYSHLEVKGLAQASASMFDIPPPTFLSLVYPVSGGFTGTLSLTAVLAKGSCGKSGLSRSMVWDLALSGVPAPGGDCILASSVSGVGEFPLAGCLRIKHNTSANNRI